MTAKGPWKGSRVNIILYINDPMPSQKANKSKKTPKKAICIKTKYWTKWVQSCQCSSPSVSWKLNTSLTQKDTMDRGSWIKIQKERHAGGLKRKKGPKAQKSEKWHGNEEKMNISVYHILQSCGVQSGSYLKTEVINETHLPGLKIVILTWKSWFPFS